MKRGMKVLGAVLILMLLVGWVTSAPAALSQDNYLLHQLPATAEKISAEGMKSSLYSASKFSIGDVVRVVSSKGSSVRKTPAGSYIKAELYNTVGIILGGPRSAY